MKGFTTKAVHGFKPKKDVHGALRTPVYDSVAFGFETSKDIQLAFEGKKPGHAYSRSSNPTIEEFEQKIRLLSKGFAVLAVSSGMAGIMNLILTLGEAGSNIVTTRKIFANTYSLFEHTLKKWGLDVKYVEMTDLEAIESAIDSKTRALFLETVSNPHLEVVDFAAISGICKAKGVPLVADSSASTPYIFKGKEAGVNIEVLSSTKYISGGATSVGGLIIDHGNFDWKQIPKLKSKSSSMGPMAFMGTLRREVYRNVGSCLTAHNAYLQSLGLETLELRIERSCANTLKMAQFLENQKSVISVNYPGLKSSPYHEMATKYFGHLYGGLLVFELKDQSQCYDFMDALKLIKRATNFNDNKSMIIHHHSTIYSEFSQAEKVELGINESQMRLSVGIESFEDLTEDILNALKVL